MTRHISEDHIMGWAASASALGCTGSLVNIELRDGETAWNPAGDHYTGPAELGYLLHRDDQGETLISHEYWGSITVTRSDTGQLPECGHDRARADAPECPDCGTEMTPDDQETQP